MATAAEIIAELQKRENQDEELNYVIIPIKNAPYGITVTYNEKPKE